MILKVFRSTLFLFAAFFGVSLQAADSPKNEAQEGAKELSGISILGNSEAPKSLVIVPWKTSELGDGIGVTNMLDERARPVDKDVFMRELGYYQLRTGVSAQTGSEQKPSVKADTLAKQ